MSSERFGWVVVAALVTACGPPPPSPSTPASTEAPPPVPPVVPGKTVRFALAVDGRPAGTELWNVRAAPDGSMTIEFESQLAGPRGAVSGKGTFAISPAHLPLEAEVTVQTPDEGGATFHLSRSGADLVMTMEHGGATDELKAGKPSNLFVPRPFFVGLAPVCALLLEREAPPLVEFPGSVVTVLAKKEMAGITSFSLDHGGLGRTLVACDGIDLVAVLDPWTGQSAVRSDRGDVGDVLRKSVERVKPPTPADLTEEDVAVPVPEGEGDDAATLACSFLRPSRVTGRLPAVVFATGSGPQDRDEDSAGRGGLKLAIFKEMAIALAEKGVASLRCDDRGTARSTGSFEKATLRTFVRDALATLTALSRRKEIDPARLGFVGHSEGAVVGPLVAAKAQGSSPSAGAPRLRAVMLMAAPGRPLPEIGMMQEEAFLQQSGLPPDQVQRQLEAQRSVMDAIRAGKPLSADIPPQHKELIEKQRAWLKSHFDNDVRAALTRMPKTKIFLAQGGKDIQVPPGDIDRVKAALAGGKNPDPLVKVYPELNHVFSASRGGGVTEYADADARIDPGFLTDAADFFARALAP